MSTENTPVEPTEQSLDDFAANFFGQEEAAPEPTNSEEPTPEPSESDAQTEEVDTHEVDEADDTLAPEADDDGAKAEPKKTRAQERIEELNARFREEERARLEEQRKRVELEERLNKLEQERSKPVKEEKVQGEPTPDDKNEDGEDKYPLGEFDPNYIRDLAKYTVTAEREAAIAAERKAREQEEIRAARQIAESQWAEKVNDARERYPDFQDKLGEMAPAFEGIDPAFGEYLTDMLMTLPNGADVLYSLAQDPASAKSIVNSGAMRATIALSAISRELELASGDNVKDTSNKSNVKVSSAPTPPPAVKGSSVAKPRVSPDTDDLDAFEREFFKKK